MLERGGQDYNPEQRVFFLRLKTPRPPFEREVPASGWRPTLRSSDLLCLLMRIAGGRMQAVTQLNVQPLSSLVTAIKYHVFQSVWLVSSFFDLVGKQGR